MKVLVLADEIYGFRVHIGEIATAPSGNPNLFARAFGVVNQQGVFARMCGAKQSCRARANDDCVPRHGGEVTVLYAWGKA